MSSQEHFGFLTFLDCFWGEIAKLDDLLFVVFEARRIKAVTQLRAADTAKQLVIRIRRRKISALILIAYRHS